MARKDRKEKSTQNNGAPEKQSQLAVLKDAFRLVKTIIRSTLEFLDCHSEFSLHSLSLLASLIQLHLHQSKISLGLQQVS